VIYSYLLNAQPLQEIAQSLGFPLGIIVAYLIVIVLVAEGLYRFIALDVELTRKVVHIGVGNVIILAWWLEIPTLIILGASAIASLLALLSYFLPILPSINSVGRKSLGTFFYGLSIGILSFTFWSTAPQYTVIGVLVMTWGDGFAAIVGKSLGKHPYSLWGESKSLEGTLAMFGVSYIVTSLTLGLQGFSWQTGVISFVVALAATGLEAISKLGIDNLTVPLGSAMIAYYLTQVATLH
jgi:phytol kinase